MFSFKLIMIFNFKKIFYFLTNCKTVFCNYTAGLKTKDLFVKVGFLLRAFS